MTNNDAKNLCELLDLLDERSREVTELTADIADKQAKLEEAIGLRRNLYESIVTLLKETDTHSNYNAGWEHRLITTLLAVRRDAKGLQ